MIAQSRRIVLAVLPILLAAPALAVEPKTATGAPQAEAVEPEARSLVEQVVAAYKALSAYSDRGALTFKFLGGDGRKVEQNPRRGITFARPNKLVLDYEAVRLISDGENLTAVVVPRKVYSVTKAPEKVDPGMVAAADVPGLARGTLLAGEGGLPISLLLELLGGDDPLKTIFEGTDRIAIEPDRQLDGQPVRPVFVDQTAAPDYRMLVDPETKLLRGVELAYDLDQINARMPEGQGLREVSLIWKAGEVGREVPDDAFTFRPPDDYQKLQPGETPPVEEPRMAVEDLVGKPAPEIAFSVLDGPDKTRQFGKADLRGKVVLLDFWATWCGPCLAELPEIQALIDDYETRAPDELAVVALSQDEKPADLDGVRRVVDETLADAGLALAEGPVGLVALDPQRAIGQAFHVSALPTLVLIDAEGVVRAVHVGNQPGVRDRLAGQIEALREGRPLKRP